MTLSREPLPAPGLRSRPARRWAAGVARCSAGRQVGGIRGMVLVMPGLGAAPGWVLVGGRTGRGGTGTAGVSPQPCCPPRTSCGRGHGAQLCLALHAKGSVGSCAERGEHPAFLPWGPCVPLWGGCVAQQSPRRMLRKGLDHTLPLPQRTAAGNPETSPNPGAGGHPGGTLVLAGAAPHLSLAHPAGGCLSVPRGLARGWRRAPVLLALGCPAQGGCQTLL